MRWPSVLISSILLFGCRTYTITSDSLRAQLLNTRQDTVRITGPLFEKHTYAANGIEMVQCVDKEGRSVKIPNSPSLEARITRVSGKRSTVYFDRIELWGDTLVGHNSRFISSMTVRIPFAEIRKVELQDSGKRFNYAEH